MCLSSPSNTLSTNTTNTMNNNNINNSNHRSVFHDAEAFEPRPMKHSNHGGGGGCTFNLFDDNLVDEVLDLDHDPVMEIAMPLIFLAEVQEEENSSTVVVTPSPVRETINAAYTAPCTVLHELRNGNSMNNTPAAPSAPTSLSQLLQQLQAKKQELKKDNDNSDFMVLDNKPKKGLSAYNLFFMNERRRLLESIPDRPQGRRKPRNSHGKLGFAAMARIIAHKWKTATKEEKAPFDAMAKQDSLRYKKAMAAWKQEQARAVLARHQQAANKNKIRQEETAVANNTTLLSEQDCNSLMNSPLSMEAEEESTTSPLFHHHQQDFDNTNNNDVSFVNAHWSHGGNNMFFKELP